MKTIDRITTILAAMLGCAAMLGLLVAFVPLAIIFPSHGEQLVRIQAGGLAVVALSFVGMVALGLFTAATERKP